MQLLSVIHDLHGKCILVLEDTVNLAAISQTNFHGFETARLFAMRLGNRRPQLPRRSLPLRYGSSPDQPAAFSAIHVAVAAVPRPEK